MAVKGAYNMVQKQSHCKKWHRHPNRTGMRYHIAQYFEGINFWQIKPEDAFGWQYFSS